MTKLSTALAALLAASTLAPVALADQAGGAIGSRDITVRINTADLDLNSPAGAQQLLSRIQDAAKDACHDRASALRNLERECRSRIVADNVARLNNNALGVAFTDVYGEKAALARR